MKSDEHEEEVVPLSSSIRQRHHQRGLAYKILGNPKACIILLITSFVLGYLSHPDPLILTRAIIPDDILQHTTFPNECRDQAPSSQVRQIVLDRVFNGTSPWQGFPPPHVSPDLLFKEWMKGWGSSNPVFEHLMQQVRPKIIIEAGTFLGASAIHMAGLARKLGLHDALIICIDDFRGWPGYYDDEKSLKMLNGDSMLLYQFMQNVVKAKATDSILYMPFSTGTALGGLCEWGVYGDLVEVDAAHDFHSAWVDINNAYKILKKPGGVLFGHDYAWDGVRYAVHHFARLNGFRIKLDGQHWILY